MRKIFVLFFVLLLGLVLTACNNNTEFDFDKGILTVGLEADYPPFNWLETEANDYNYPIYGTNNFVAGYDVDMAIKVADELDLELRIVALTWESLIPALQSGDIDLIIAGMSPRPDRLEQINFTDAYYTVQHVVVVRADSEFANATELDDLAGANGVGQVGTVYADLVDYVVDNHGAKALPVMDTIPQITNAILTGVADFTVVERPVALGMANANNQLKIVLDTNENIFNVSDEDRLLSIGFRKIDTTLGELVNEVLAGITTQTREQWMANAIERSGE